MKLIDEKGKVFGKINAIDLGIIILVLVLCFGTYYKFFRLENTSVSKGMEPIKYDVFIQGSRVYLKDALKTGDILYDKTSGNAIGTIVEIKSEPSKQDFQLLNGTFKECEVPSRFDITLTVEAQGADNKVNRAYELVINSAKNFKTKYANATGKVSKIY